MTDTVKTILDAIDTNLILCLPAMTLTIILAKSVFKNRLPAKEALNVIRWVIIVYTILSILYMTWGLIFRPEKFDFVSRATGPYMVTYWLMFFCAVILPFSLFIKKLAANPYYILLLAFLLKIGRYFEIFVMQVISFHRDFGSDNNSEWFKSQPSAYLMIMLQGFILAVLLLGIIATFKRNVSLDVSS